MDWIKKLGVLRGVPAERVAENAAGGWSEGETSPYKVYNIGNNKPSSLMNFVEILENCLIKEGIISEPGKKELLPMQPGDVYQTYADVSEFERDFGFNPSTSLEEGMGKFAEWYKTYYKR